MFYIESKVLGAVAETALSRDWNTLFENYTNQPLAPQPLVK